MVEVSPAPEEVPVAEAARATEPADILFREARTAWRWSGEGVSDETIRELYELLKFGPTSANCSPARSL